MCCRTPVPHYLPHLHCLPAYTTCHVRARSQSQLPPAAGDAMRRCCLMVSALSTGVAQATTTMTFKTTSVATTVATSTATKAATAVVRVQCALAVCALRWGGGNGGRAGGHQRWRCGGVVLPVVALTVTVAARVRMLVSVCARAGVCVRRGYGGRVGVSIERLLGHLVHASSRHPLHVRFDTALLDSTDPKKNSDGGSCSSGGGCTSGTCRGGSCCGTKGKSTGFTACDSDGDCQTCTSGYTKKDYACVATSQKSGALPSTHTHTHTHIG